MANIEHAQFFRNLESLEINFDDKNLEKGRDETFL